MAEGFSLKVVDRSEIALDVIAYPDFKLDAT
jgi:hypothetical protein